MISISRTIDLRGLACFLEVARLLSVTRAAEALGLSKSAVSKHLSELEARLGVRLLERTSRRIQLTVEGRNLQPQAESVLAEVERLDLAARSSRAEPEGLVQVAATPEFGAHLSEHFVPEVLARYPGLRVAMTADYRFEDLQNPAYDVAFRIGRVHDDGLVARALGSFRRFVVASPAFAAAHPVSTPAALSALPCLIFSGRATESTWSQVGAEGAVEVPVRGRQAVASFSALLRLAVAGRGVANLPDFLAAPALAAGTLVRLLPAWQSPPTALYLAHRPGAERIQRVRVVLELARALVPGLLTSASAEAGAEAASAGAR